MSNESRRDANPTPRVYKSTEVHKRRTGGSSRADRPGLFGRGASTLAEQVPSVVADEAPAVAPEQDEEARAAVAARQVALQSALPEVDASPSPASPEPQVAKPADEMAKAAEEIVIDDTIDRQTFDSMPTTRLQAIGEFVSKKIKPVEEPAPPVEASPEELSGKTEAIPIAGERTQGQEASASVSHDAPSYARRAGRSGMNVSQIDPGKQNEDAARRRRVVVAAAAVVAVIVVAAIAVFAWNRWGRYDDKVDIQGEWYVVDTTVPVQIDDHSIKLTDNVAYEYVIDQNEKTIKYTFGTMEGQGHYWFSEDRQYLVIADGDNYTGTSTTVDDLVRTFSELTATVTGQDYKLPEGNGIIAFSKTPDPKAQAEKEQAAAKQQEEQARQAAAAASQTDETASSASASTTSSTATDDDEYVDYDDEYVDDEYTDDELAYDDSEVFDEEADVAEDDMTDESEVDYSEDDEGVEYEEDGEEE